MSATDRRARYRDRNPEWDREFRRRKDRRNVRANQLLRAMYPDEYARQRRLSQARGQAKVRAAQRVLRQKYPTDWDACREQARREIQ